MKHILAIALILFSGVASAHGYGHGGGYHRPHYNWAAPVIIGGALGYGLGRYYAAPVITQPAPVYVPTQTCSEWREVIQPDGRIVRERTCYQQ